MAYLTMLFWLLVAHVVCDYPLQGDFLARAKNHKQPIPRVPWCLALASHALIQAGGVALVTHQPALAVVELVDHFAVDWFKSNGNTSFVEDQLLHVSSRALFAGCALLMTPPIAPVIILPTIQKLSWLLA